MVMVVFDLIVFVDSCALILVFMYCVLFVLDALCSLFDVLCCRWCCLCFGDLLCLVYILCLVWLSMCV
jgi:hypothetical protein